VKLFYIHPKITYVLQGGNYGKIIRIDFRLVYQMSGTEFIHDTDFILNYSMIKPMEYEILTT
jgi:hypothetical protein